jgi:TrmH family RNA methyltransferase
MPESRLSRVVVVLYEPQDYINIAAVVRAMKNMGMASLRLVRPVPFDPVRLEGIAHDTQDVIDRIRTFATPEEALADCTRVLAFTARRRAAKFRIIPPREAAAEVMDAIEATDEGTVALLFGREDSGLPNDVMDMAQVGVRIPTTDHASLNLAQAAVIAFYELHLAAGDATRRVDGPRHSAPPPPHEELERYYADAHRALDAIEFFKTRNAEYIMRSIRSLTSRALPDSRELSLLRAMSIEVVRYLERTGRRS